MGNKADYEAKKAARVEKRARIETSQKHSAEEDAAMKEYFFDLLESFVGAVERIADAMEVPEVVTADRPTIAGLTDEELENMSTRLRK